MVPEQLFKRRRQHNNTPETLMLIITNYVVVAVSVQIFARCSHINSFFWVVVGLLAIYNFFTVRRYREEYDRVQTIVYIASLVGLVGMFFLFRINAASC